jgi:hypothetical protein
MSHGCSETLERVSRSNISRCWRSRSFNVFSPFRPIALRNGRQIGTGGHLRLTGHLRGSGASAGAAVWSRHAPRACG